MIVSIAIVAYNEENTIEHLLNDIDSQTYPHDRIELLLVDGGSTDGTKKIMDDFAKKNHCYKDVLVLDNPKKRLGSGCNVALKSYTGDAFIRIDAHARIPQDFIAKNVANLQGGEKVSGGRRPNIIDDSTPWKETLLMAESSMFGSSFALYRRSPHKRYVDSLFHGMYMREVFDKAGYYNENLFRTEDNEMSYRIRKTGYRMCYDPEILSYQHTRNSLRGMLKQKYLNGYWIGLTLGVCPRCMSVFHFVPFMFIIAIAVTAITAITLTIQPLIFLWACYAVANILMSLQAIVQNGFKPIYLMLPSLFLMLHISYGIGTLVGIITLPFKLKSLRSKN